MAKFRLDKLIRDGLVDKFKQDGYTVEYRALSEKEHLAALQQKVLEEAAELPAHVDPSEAVSELADVYQALADYALKQGISPEEIEAERLRKLETKGGFSGASFVETVELPEDDPWTDYFRKHPDYSEEQ